eukprot:Opistho-1_new@65757
MTLSCGPLACVSGIARSALRNAVASRNASAWAGSCARQVSNARASAWVAEPDVRRTIQPNAACVAGGRSLASVSRTVIGCGAPGWRPSSFPLFLSVRQSCRTRDERLSFTQAARAQIDAASQILLDHADAHAEALGKLMVADVAQKCFLKDDALPFGQLRKRLCDHGDIGPISGDRRGPWCVVRDIEQCLDIDEAEAPVVRFDQIMRGVERGAIDRRLRVPDRRQRVRTRFQPDPGFLQSVLGHLRAESAGEPSSHRGVAGEQRAQ